MKKERTRTFKYLFPSIYYGNNGNLRKLFDELGKNKLLINAYVRDTDKISQDNCLYLLIKLNDIKASDLDNYLEGESRFVESYSPMEGVYMMVFKVEENPYSNFIQSKYSKIYDRTLFDEFIKVQQQSSGKLEPEKFKNDPLCEVYLLSSEYNKKNIGVLLKSEEKKEEIMKDLDIDEDSLPDEYDSIWNPEEEYFSVEKYLKVGESKEV